ncbi:Molybdenum cofactor biosynthesis protein C [Oopsacas minuta]|uniref:cyclic pyranopterin monophosphate synthase n=1 Tax=Oopsacas minuta TaxID=111878 RepID=A0AAV7JJY5_9METZ|nr:Molybdenum cofactor biosynthesis protein C [Oopsacas minuta]
MEMLLRLSKFRFIFPKIQILPTSNSLFSPRSYSYDELSHLNKKGEINMVDVGAKRVSKRYTKAVATINFGDSVFKSLTNNFNFTKKGNIFEVAKLSGIMAAKRTSELIPLCHSVPLDHVSIEVTPLPDSFSLRLTCEVTCESKTGCEMEALLGVNVACLAVYDMCKSLSHNICIERVQLVEKSGGKSGHFINNFGNS